MPVVVDVLIVGGGIAGVSLAARLSESRRVAVVEAEAHLGSHSTGRSAALLVEAYGPPVIRALTGMSRAFFESPPPEFSEAPLAGHRGALVYAGADQLAELTAQFELARRSTNVVWLGPEQIATKCPLLRPAVAAAAFLEPDALDLDTNALLQGFARSASRHGAQFIPSAPVRRIEKRSEGWLVWAGEHEIACGVLVNACGAWADSLADMAGVSRAGLQPRRRTAATIPVPEEQAGLLGSAPFVAPVDNSFYFKPEAGAVMVSLADETPSEPCDAFADDFDVAVALDRFHAATIVPPARPIATWAGLRTFAPDGNPVVGFEEAAPGFFWLAGQGGYGIQTAPALSAMATRLILMEELTPAEAALAATLSPARLRHAA